MPGGCHLHEWKAVLSPEAGTHVTQSTCAGDVRGQQCQEPDTGSVLEAGCAHRGRREGKGPRRSLSLQPG